MDAQSKKRSRIALAALTLALLVCATVPAIWFGARFWAVTAIDTWREQERLAGREWTCATPATSGFPFRLVYVCPEPTVRFAGRAGAAHATARSLEISASLADPLLLEARLSGPFTFAETAGPNASFDWKRFEVDLRFAQPQRLRDLRPVPRLVLPEHIHRHGRDGVGNHPHTTRDGQQL